jgi:hypothetical protein
MEAFRKWAGDNIFKIFAAIIAIVAFYIRTESEISDLHNENIEVRKEIVEVETRLNKKINIINEHERRIVDLEIKLAVAKALQDKHEEGDEKLDQ